MRATSVSSCAHLALFYRDEEDYVGVVLPFLADGVARGAAVLVAVPPQRRALLDRHPDGLRDHLSFADLRDLGRNPGRIIPEVRRFADAHAGRPLAFVGEPIWPGRTPAETRAATSHEALLNLAFAGRPGAILCPYDAAGLAPEVLADAEVTHPLLLEVGVRRSSARFVPPSTVHGPVPPLPPPPGWADALAYGPGRLMALRRFVRRHARAAGSRPPGSWCASCATPATSRTPWWAATCPPTTRRTAAGCGRSTSCATWSRCGRTCRGRPPGCTCGLRPRRYPASPAGTVVTFP